MRDYGEETVTVWDGEAGCEHEWASEIKKWHGDRGDGVRKEVYDDSFQIQGTQHAFCTKCGAWRGQLGLEPSLELYLKHLLQITAELKRVLKPTGVLFWNHGDSYGGSGSQGDQRNTNPRLGESDYNRQYPSHSMPAKCMCLQNYRLLIKLIDEQGWVARNVNIWNKPNHMPSSVKDRFTNGYEPIFMLTKNQRYWFDLDAVREPHAQTGIERCKYPHSDCHNATGKSSWCQTKDNPKRHLLELNPSGKNPGDVWTMPTQPFPDAHFAVFPEELPERCIKCGCPKEICTQCGKARVRITELGDVVQTGGGYVLHSGNPNKLSNGAEKTIMEQREHKTIGWTICSCPNPEYRPGIVLDPFLGSGTTMKVARRMGMSCIGIEISPKYVAMAKREVRWQEGLDISFEHIRMEA